MALGDKAVCYGSSSPYLTFFIIINLIVSQSYGQLTSTFEKIAPSGQCRSDVGNRKEIRARCETECFYSCTDMARKDGSCHGCQYTPNSGSEGGNCKSFSSAENVTWSSQDGCTYYKMKTLDIVCPEGWTRVQNLHCYKTIKTPKFWEDAAKHCQHLGGSLVTIESSHVSSLINSFRISQGILGCDVWIGLSDISVEGKWIWRRTGKETTFTVWDISRSEPNGKRVENCVHLRSNKHKVWNDNRCSSKLYFICEYTV